METRLGIVTGRTVAPNRGRGVPVRLLQVMVTDRSDVQTVQLIEQAGEESNPPDGSLVVLLPAGKAVKLAVSAHDGVTPDLEVGGKRIYSIGPDRQPIASLRLDPDGTITASNPGATVTIAPDGTVSITADGELSITSPHTRINGPLTATGTITAPTVVGTTDVTFAGKSAATHTHPGDSGGTTGAPS